MNDGHHSFPARRHAASAYVKQRDVFLNSEGDAYFRRNVGAVSARAPDSDALLAEVLALPEADVATGSRVLEIGCGEGNRLAWLRDARGCECFGLDPSALAVERARSRGIEAHRGTADRLPFEDAQFDVVLFGFCLYLCDRADLFRIASEADRVLRNPGWLLILDFFSPVPAQRAYHHREGLFSYKMDYTTLFTWNPSYTLYSHQVRHHSNGTYTDDPHEWVSTSVLRKDLQAGR
jgi:ubiquinone/menaquinone biosynthesis C-methylase UbiE